VDLLKILNIFNLFVQETIYADNIENKLQITSISQCMKVGMNHEAGYHIDLIFT